MYRVIKEFVDLQDNNHIYAVGDEFPHSGAVADAGRVLELSSSVNKIGEPLIEEVIDVEDVEVVKEEPTEEAAEKPKRTKKTSNKVKE